MATGQSKAKTKAAAKQAPAKAKAATQKDAAKPFQNIPKGFLELCQASLLLHEGKRAKVYLDTEDHPTIGIGFNLDRADADEAIEAMGLDYKKVRAGEQILTDEQIMTLLQADLLRSIADAIVCVSQYTALSEVRKLVIVDMIFNLGRTRFRGFEKMIAAVNEKRYTKASEEMLDSLWAKQVKTRAKRLSLMMKTGVLSQDIEKHLPKAKTAKGALVAKKSSSKSASRSRLA